MPTDPSKRVQQILELPPGMTSDQLQTTLNDRIRDLNGALGNSVQNPALGEVDLATFKIINLADPKDDLDAVNLRTLKKFAGTGSAQQATPGLGIEQPTIYFTFDGLPFDGEESPYAIIMSNRAGFSLTGVSLSAVGAPTSAPLAINLQIGTKQLLKADLELPIGQSGPVFATDFTAAASLQLGTLLQALINKAGGATQVTIALALRGV